MKIVKHFKPNKRKNTRWWWCDAESTKNLLYTESTQYAFRWKPSSRYCEKKPYQYSLCVIYYLPNANKHQLFKELDEFLDNCKSFNRACILRGDFNIDLIPKKSSLAKSFEMCLFKAIFHFQPWANSCNSQQFNFFGSIYHLHSKISEQHSVLLNIGNYSGHYPVHRIVDEVPDF